MAEGKVKDTFLRILLLKAHVLTGCDITSKFGSKSFAVKNNLENFLLHFGNSTLGNDSFLEAKSKSCWIIIEMIFHKLRYRLWSSRKKLIAELPLKIQSVEVHMQRCHHVVNLCEKLSYPQEFTLEPINYGWEEINSILCPDKCMASIPEGIFVACGCIKGGKGRGQCKKKDVDYTDEYRKCNGRCE